MRRPYFGTLTFCGLALLAGVCQADDAESSQLQVASSNLDNPSGVAVQPGTGDIFIAERRGIFRLTPQEEESGDPSADAQQVMQKFAEVTGFPTDTYGKGPMYDIGPLGLAFADAETLIVGDGSRPDGEELVYSFAISNEPAEQPQQESDATHTFGPIPKSDQSVSGEGNFYGVAVLDGHFYITNNGDDTKGWISHGTVGGGDLELFIATKPAVEVDAPVAITTNDDGELVVGQMGEMTQPGDSLLTFYDPETGDLKASYETGLSDIAGLAYSPVTGKLYAADFSWHDTSQGGLFELAVADGKCTATKLFSLDKPTALTFDQDGNLYVASFGTAEEDADEKPGKIHRIDASQLNEAG